MTQLSIEARTVHTLLTACYRCPRLQRIQPRLFPEVVHIAELEARVASPRRTLLQVATTILLHDIDGGMEDAAVIPRGAKTMMTAATAVAVTMTKTAVTTIPILDEKRNLPEKSTLSRI